MRNIVKTSLIAMASTALLGAGCETDTEPADAAAPAGTEIQEETPTLKSQCSCECTVCPENSKPDCYFMGSDTKIEINGEFIQVSSKRVTEQDDGFMQYMENCTD